MRRPINGWALASGFGAVVAIIGAFLPLLSVGGRQLSGSTVTVGNAVAWSVSDRTTMTLLLERRDLAVLVMALVVALAVLCLMRRFTRWSAGIGVLLSALGFHLLLTMVQRGEVQAVPALQQVTYAPGAVMCLSGALMSLVGFIAVLGRRH